MQRLFIMWSKRQQSVRILTLSNSDTFQFCHFPILTLSDSDTFRFWHFLILTLSDSDIFRFWHFLILTLSNSDIFQSWHFPILTLSNSDTFQVWHIPIMELSNPPTEQSSSHSLFVSIPEFTSGTKILRDFDARVAYLLQGRKFGTSLLRIQSWVLSNLFIEE